MFASTSALRFASRSSSRFITATGRSISSKAKGSSRTVANEEYLRKALPFLVAGGVVAIGSVSQFSKVCVII